MNALAMMPGNPFGALSALPLKEPASGAGFENIIKVLESANGNPAGGPGKPGTRSNTSPQELADALIRSMLAGTAAVAETQQAPVIGKITANIAAPPQQVAQTALTDAPEPESAPAKAATACTSTATVPVVSTKASELASAAYKNIAAPAVAVATSIPAQEAVSTKASELANAAYQNVATPAAADASSTQELVWTKASELASGAYKNVAMPTAASAPSIPAQEPPAALKHAPRESRRSFTAGSRIATPSEKTTSMAAPAAQVVAAFENSPASSNRMPPVRVPQVDVATTNAPQNTPESEQSTVLAMSTTFSAADAPVIIQVEPVASQQIPQSPAALPSTGLPTSRRPAGAVKQIASVPFVQKEQAAMPSTISSQPHYASPQSVAWTPVSSTPTPTEEPAASNDAAPQTKSAGSGPVVAAQVAASVRTVIAATPVRFDRAASSAVQDAAPPQTQPADAAPVAEAPVAFQVRLTPANSDASALPMAAPAAVDETMTAQAPVLFAAVPDEAYPAAAPLALKAPPQKKTESEPRTARVATAAANPREPDDRGPAPRISSVGPVFEASAFAREFQSAATQATVSGTSNAAAPGDGTKADSGPVNVAETLRASEPMPPAAAPDTTAAPVQQIAVRISHPDTAPVDLHVSERAGEIHVSVRTADGTMQTSLRQDLGTLTSSLERAGYRAEMFAPRETAGPTTSAAMNLRNDRQQQGFQGRGGSGNFSNGRQQQQPREQRKKTWLSELENSK